MNPVMKNKRIIFVLVVVVALLLIPFVAMQFTDEVAWKTSDFIVMGVLLSGTGLLAEIATRKVKSLKNRIMVLGIILLLFLLIWVELAVGIFGTAFGGY